MQNNTLTAAYPAELRTVDDKLLEIGEATIQFENRSVDFQSEFVQLFKMDTPLKIVILMDGVEIQSFSGKVYLSSQSMLRLVDVSDIILPDAYLIYQCDVNISGTVIATITNMVKKSRFNNSLKKVTGIETFPAEIYRISMNSVSFTCDKTMDKGQLIKLSIVNPPIKHVDLEIEKVFEFGENIKNYHCRISGINDHSNKNLGLFISNICEERLKLF